MQSFDQKKFHSFRADASALGGFLEKPFQKVIPTLAPVSLPPVGGFATARSEAFNLDEIISCSSAYTRVSGKERATDGSSSILITAVVEGLNILEVVTAQRIVAQISLSISKDGGPAKVSLTGSGFEGLRLAGRDGRPSLNVDLHQPAGGKSGDDSPLTWRDIQRAGREQADRLINCFKDRRDEDGYRWALKRHGWMTSDSSQTEGGNLLCSLVDGFEGAGADRACGHIVEIPGFGRIILGELRVRGDSVQLVAIRAELGCPIEGQIGVCCVGGGGSGDN
jgi:hypothetical protein